MENPLKINKRKTAMVLHEIETSLGNYILESDIAIDVVPGSLIDGIESREKRRNSDFKITKVSSVVESTYLDELFLILLEVTKGSSLYPYVIEMRESFVKYDIYNIRNIISHPNRSFNNSNWYKVAAMASDPIIEILGLTSIQNSLISAERGEISDPPEEWLQRNFWQIKNNLPNQLDHAITGLLGRKKELTEVLNTLKSPRINTIAIVAPGGMGKTALALDLLDKIVKDPESNEWCEACIFISLKNEILTSEGVKKINAVDTIEDIKSLIVSEFNEIDDSSYSSFYELTEDKKNEKILLFIDNLETLLIDYSDEFELFNEELPAKWRLLLTSRVSINSARVINLSNLQTDMAIQLAKLYNVKRGMVQLDDDKIAYVAENCYNNPLAIRLTLDLINLGKDIPDSLDIASKEIANFSYKNLIETLDVNSVSILEMLYLEPNCSRSDISDLLKITRESVSESISQLCNTSLILRRYDDKEKLKLSDSIIEFLVTNERNIEIRQELQEVVNKRKARIREVEKNQGGKRVPEYRWDYLPKNINDSLKLLLIKYHKLLKGTYLPQSRKLTQLAREFQESEHFHVEEPYFHLAYAKILNAIKANSTAIRHFDIALELQPKNPCIKLFKANTLHSTADYPSAISIYNELISEGWGNLDIHDRDFVIELINMRYLSMLYYHEYDVILDETKDWQNNAPRGLLGAFRANAIKRNAESLEFDDITSNTHEYKRIISIFSDIFNSGDYSSKVCLLSKSIFNQIGYHLLSDTYFNNNIFAENGLRFILNYFIETESEVNYKEEDDIVKLIVKLTHLNRDDNPFKTPKWKVFLCGINKLYGVDDYGVKDDYILTQVTNIPKNTDGKARDFVFCVDAKGVNYFVHLSVLNSLDKDKWGKIKIGSKIGVNVYDKNNYDNNDDKAVRVDLAYILN